MEEGKADVLGLFMVTKLQEMGELSGTLEDNYVTFLAGLFRSVRFGAADAHGRANMVGFNFFKERGAFSRDANGQYRVDMAKMRRPWTSYSATVLKLQGDGDYAGVQKLIGELGVIRPQLAEDLERLKRSNIPVDVDVHAGQVGSRAELRAAA